jgi:hypothetical protein
MGVSIVNSGKKIRFDCVDTWEGSEDQKVMFDCSDLYGEFKRNTESLAITSIVAASVDAAKVYDDASLDFVFLDGSHNRDDVCADVLAWRPKLKPSTGVLAGDDLKWASVQVGLKKAGLEAVMLSAGPYFSWILPLGDAEPWVTPREEKEPMFVDVQAMPTVRIGG